MISYYEFLMSLEWIALDNNLRLIMTRAPSGCGWLFGFVNEHGEYSKPVSLLINHKEPEELFDELDKIAKEFRKES